MRPRRRLSPPGSELCGCQRSSHRLSLSRRLEFLLCPDPQSVKIISDSTLINRAEHAKCMFYAVSMLAMVVGTGWFTARRVYRLVQPPPGTLIAYVPGDNSHLVHQYQEHAESQKQTFPRSQYLFRTPTLPEFNDVYESAFGDAMLVAGREHLTEHGQKWLIWALSKWAHARKVRLVLCIDWSITNPHHEYTRLYETIVPP